jgi:hypothetical protein
MTVLLDAAGRRRSPATLPGYHAGRPPRNKGMRYPADPPNTTSATSATPISSRASARDGVGAGPRRWRGLTRVTLAQNVSCDGDVGRGDEHVTRTGGQELRHIEARRATDDRAHVRIA